MWLFFKAYILVDCLKQFLNQIIILQQTCQGLKDLFAIIKAVLIVNYKARAGLGNRNHISTSEDFDVHFSFMIFDPDGVHFSQLNHFFGCRAFFQIIIPYKSIINDAYPLND